MDAQRPADRLIIIVSGRFDVQKRDFATQRTRENKVGPHYIAGLKGLPGEYFA